MHAGDVSNVWTWMLLIGQAAIVIVTAGWVHHICEGVILEQQRRRRRRDG